MNIRRAQIGIITGKSREKKEEKKRRKKSKTIFFLSDILFDLTPPLFKIRPLNKSDPKINLRLYKHELVPLKIDRKKFRKNFGVFSKIIAQKSNRNSSEVLVLFKKKGQRKEQAQWMSINDLIFSNL